MAIVAGADGCVDAREVTPTGDCCPPTLAQMSYCAMACAFIELLPSGPLWDKPKEQMMARYREREATGVCDPAICEPEEPQPNMTCQSVVSYAVFSSYVLMDNLLNALWPSLRESDPFTAVTTIDEWLERLGWEDCYRTACRSPSLGSLTPYEIPGECGPIYCPVPIPEDLECAIKRGLVHSLSRASMGGVRNLCWINWVIEPLGGAVSVADVEGSCTNKILTISPLSDTLPKCPTDLCPVAINQPQGTVVAKVETQTPEDCDIRLGLPDVIWPGLLSAACIVRSLLPSNLANNVRVAC